MSNSIKYIENGITEYISIDKPTIQRAINEAYVENVFAKLPKEAVKSLFELFTESKTKKPAQVSIGNYNSYQTNMGKQKFLHVFVDTFDESKHNVTYNFLVSNYEILQYDKITQQGSVRMTKIDKLLFNSDDTFKMLSLLFASSEDYKKNWIIYNLAKENVRHGLMSENTSDLAAQNQEEQLHEKNTSKIMEFACPCSYPLIVGKHVVEPNNQLEK